MMGRAHEATNFPTPRLACALLVILPLISIPHRADGREGRQRPTRDLHVAFDRYGHDHSIASMDRLNGQSILGGEEIAVDVVLDRYFAFDPAWAAAPASPGANVFLHQRHGDTLRVEPFLDRLYAWSGSGRGLYVAMIAAADRATFEQGGLHSTTFRVPYDVLASHKGELEFRLDTTTTGTWPRYTRGRPGSMAALETTLDGLIADDLAGVVAIGAVMLSREAHVEVQHVLGDQLTLTLWSVADGVQLEEWPADPSVEEIHLDDSGPDHTLLKCERDDQISESLRTTTGWDPTHQSVVSCSLGIAPGETMKALHEAMVDPSAALFYLVRKPDDASSSRWHVEDGPLRVDMLRQPQEIRVREIVNGEARGEVIHGLPACGPDHPRIDGLETVLASIRFHEGHVALEVDHRHAGVSGGDVLASIRRSSSIAVGPPPPEIRAVQLGFGVTVRQAFRGIGAVFTVSPIFAPRTYAKWPDRSFYRNLVTPVFGLKFGEAGNILSVVAASGFNLVPGINLFVGFEFGTEHITVPWRAHRTWLWGLSFDPALMQQIFSFRKTVQDMQSSAATSGAGGT